MLGIEVLWCLTIIVLAYILIRNFRASRETERKKQFSPESYSLITCGDPPETPKKVDDKKGKETEAKDAKSYGSMLKRAQNMMYRFAKDQDFEPGQSIVIYGKSDQEQRNNNVKLFTEYRGNQEYNSFGFSIAYADEDPDNDLIMFVEQKSVKFLKDMIDRLS